MSELEQILASRDAIYQFSTFDLCVARDELDSLRLAVARLEAKVRETVGIANRCIAERDDIKRREGGIGEIQQIVEHLQRLHGQLPGPNTNYVLVIDPHGCSLIPDTDWSFKHDVLGVCETQNVLNRLAKLPAKETVAAVEAGIRHFVTICDGQLTPAGLRKLAERLEKAQ